MIGLGPILFLIYINDIVDLFSNSDVSTKLFADDIKIYLKVTSEADYSTLQKSINKIFDWSKTWQLKLANDKCQHNYISLSTVACCNVYFVSDARRNLAYFQTPPANFLLSRPYAAEYCNSEKFVKHKWFLYT